MEIAKQFLLDRAPIKQIRQFRKINDDLDRGSIPIRRARNGFSDPRNKWSKNGKL